MENWQISLDEIEEETGISHGSIMVILHENLHMNKVCAKWILKKRKDEMKQHRVTISIALLTRYNLDPQDFPYRLVTCDETWIYLYDAESTQELMKWKHMGSPKTKKFKVARSTKKVTATY